MKYIIILSYFLISGYSYGQNHNSEKITTQTTALYFDNTEFRGFIYEGITYFVNDDLQSVVAIKNKKIIWEKNVVLECEKTKSSQSKIQSLKLHKGSLHASYGKVDIWILLDGEIFVCGSN